MQKKFPTIFILCPRYVDRCFKKISDKDELTIYHSVIPWEFFTPVFANNFPLKSQSKSPQVSSALFNVLADLCNAVVSIVSIRPPIFNTSSPLNKSLVVVPITPIKQSITVTFMLYNSIYSLAVSRCLVVWLRLCVSFS